MAFTGIYKVKLKNKDTGEISTSRGFYNSEEDAKEVMHHNFELVSCEFVPQSEWSDKEHESEAICSRYAYNPNADPNPDRYPW